MLSGAHQSLPVTSEEEPVLCAEEWRKVAQLPDILPKGPVKYELRKA
jgi:hypothetical protein